MRITQIVMKWAQVAAMLLASVPGFGGALIAQAGSGARTASPYNVLFIAIDDLNDWIGVLGGNAQAITPNMDRLAQRGVLFANAHASMAVCVASRNSLMSGLHPTTTGWYTGDEDIRSMVNSYQEVMKGREMLPAYFKSQGYRTSSGGKIFHSGATDYPFLLHALWDDVLPDYSSQVTGKFLERGEGYKGYNFYPFPKNGSQLKRQYGDKLGGGHSLCGGPLDPDDIPGGKMFDELIADYAVKKLGEKHDVPFFLAVGFVRPHMPYTAPRKYFEMYERDKIRLPDVPDDEMNDIPLMGKAIAYGSARMGDHQAVMGIKDYWRDMVHAYLACISFVDDELGRVLRALDESPYAHNTIIVLWSDNGQNLGEKKHWRKMCLWEESTHVPLYISVPGNPNNGRKCFQPVSLLDLYPTLVDICGLQGIDHLEGRSLAPLLADPEKDWPYPVLSNWMYNNYSVRSARYRYIQYRDGTAELYDHQSDPSEHINLAGDAAYRGIVVEHKKWIPVKVALPAGSKTWTADYLEKRFNGWRSKGVPTWLN